MLFSLISSFLRGKEGGSLIFNLSLKIILPLYEVSKGLYEPLSEAHRKIS